MQVWGACLLLVAVGLAGCSDSGGELKEDNLAVDEELKATSDTGVIRGVVVDKSITPVAGATVELMNTEKSTMTNENGEFGFSNLDPGSYFLKVSKNRFTPTQASVEVKAGVERPPIIRVLIEANPSADPFSEVRQWEGLIQCSLRFVVNAIALCSVGNALGDDFAERYSDIDKPVTHAQSEMVWSNTQTLGESLKVQYTDDSSGLDNYAIAQGPSPQRIIAKEELLATKNLASSGLYVRVFTGDYQGTGLSLTLQQRFSVFTSIYQNYEPPEDWWFVDGNGLHPPPSE